jgi:hypothetical protein
VDAWVGLYDHGRLQQEIAYNVWALRLGRRVGGWDAEQQEILRVAGSMHIAWCRLLEGWLWRNLINGHSRQHWFLLFCSLYIIISHTVRVHKATVTRIMRTSPSLA